MPYFPPAGGGGGGAPSGPAGGSLAGSYPNPSIAAGVITSTEIASQTITAAEIAPGTITANEIANETIGDDEISPTAAIAQSKIDNLTNDLAGKVGGAIEANEIAFGNGTNSIAGDARLTWNAGTGDLSVTDAGSANTILMHTDPWPLIESTDSMNINIANFAGALGLQAGGNDLVLIGGDDGGGQSYLQSQNGVRIEARGPLVVTDYDGSHTATLKAQDSSSVTAPLNLSMSELQLNGAAGNSGEVLTSNGTGAAPTWQAVTGGGSTKIARSYWVAKNGNDVTADGSVGKPFATVMAALALGTSEVPAPSGSAGNNYFEVCIAPGDYLEDITITRVNVILRGASSEFGRCQATVLRGQLTINPASGVSKFNNRIGLQNLFLSGHTSDTYTLRITGTQQFGVDIDSCYIYMQNIGNGPVVLADNTNATRSRINIANTTINCDEANQPCFDLGGTMELQAGDTVQFQHTQAGGNALKVSGSASAICDTCSFDSVSAAAIDISGTQAGSFKVALSNCGISSSTSDGVNIAANSLTIILVRCVFTVATLAKNAILLTAPATAVTYVNAQNLASPSTSATKSAGVTSVPYTTL